MRETFIQIEDFLIYCQTKGLSIKTIKSYEQTLKLFERYLVDLNITSFKKVTARTIFKPLPNAVPLVDSLGEMLAPQYKRDIGEQAEYVPTAYNGLWRCTCGALNRIDESSCHSCNLNKIEQIKNLDHNILAANKRAFDMAEEEKARILAEQDRIKRQQAEEKQRAENLETKKQIKKLVIVGICLAIIGVAGFAINSIVKKSNLYESAIESYQNEKPVSLLGVLDKLNELPSDYKDTQRYIDEINSIIRNLNGSYRWEGVTYWGGEPMPTLLTFTIDNNQFGAPGGSYDKAEILWYIENGTIVSGEVTIPDKSNPEDWHLKNFELTPTETGFDLKARKRDGFRDIFYCKEYTKQ